jgi:hypothetical protein
VGLIRYRAAVRDRGLPEVNRWIAAQPVKVATPGMPCDHPLHPGKQGSV